MYRVLSGGMLAALVTFGFSPGAHALSGPVQRSGNTFYRAVCATAVGLAAQCHSHVVTDVAGNMLSYAHPPIGGKSPADLRDAYKITANGSPSTIVAIVDAFGYDNAEAELGVYRAQWGLPECTTKNGCFKKLNWKGHEKHYPPQNNGWALESALDLDMASAMCPNCTLYLIEAKTNSFGHLGEAVDTAAALGAHVISNSYGGTESNRVAQYEPFYDHPGVAVTASTGDSGYGQQAPADMPNVIAVGGTRLVADGSKRGWAETVWGGAGSGCSHVFQKPAWQTDKRCKNRMISDVSAVADPNTGVAVYFAGAWHVVGGTSVSAPLVGGIFGANGGAVDAASTIYANSSALFDVTTGNNGTCRKHAQYFCTGEAGYDGPTGLGTPKGTAAFGN